MGRQILQGVMSCPECKNKLQVRISTDDIMEPPWKACNVMRKMDYPYVNIIHSMKDPKVTAFWLITMPLVLGGFNYDDDVKQKIWWAYELNSLLEEKVQPYMCSISKGVLPPSIVIQSNDQQNKIKNTWRRWWFF